jgi:hypothetical protein
MPARRDISSEKLSHNENEIDFYVKTWKEEKKRKELGHNFISIYKI